MAETRPSIAAKRRTFAQLHASGCFLIPNPWDIGTACYLQSLGFKALATTSSGFGWSKGRMIYVMYFVPNPGTAFNPEGVAATPKLAKPTATRPETTCCSA